MGELCGQQSEKEYSSCKLTPVSSGRRHLVQEYNSKLTRLLDTTDAQSIDQKLLLPSVGTLPLLGKTQ